MQTMNLPTGKLRYTLTNDYLFHIVFQKNKKILRGLIRSLLNLQNEEIVDITLENRIQSGNNINDKSIVLDLLITLNGNRKLNIEMQVLNRKDWPERSLTYLSMSFDKLKSGVSKDKAILQLMNHFQLSTEEAVTKVDTYWK